MRKSTFEGQFYSSIQITTAKCKFAIDQIYVNLTPKLPQQINDAIKYADYETIKSAMRIIASETP